MNMTMFIALYQPWKQSHVTFITSNRIPIQMVSYVSDLNDLSLFSIHARLNVQQLATSMVNYLCDTKQTWSW